MNNGNIQLPISPFSKEQTDEMKRLHDMLPQFHQYIMDAKNAGQDTSLAEEQYRQAKEQLDKLVKVYGNKYG